MRPRLLILVFCLLFFPILLTFISFLKSSPRVSSPSPFAGRATGLHALFSFNLPSSLFPPSAIISLTDENSTFFLARPAAFGPLLPEKGLSGQLWVGSGFGERSTKAAGGELGCSDIPGWEQGDSHLPTESYAGKPGSNDKDTQISHGQRHAEFMRVPDTQSGANAGSSLPANDGTDDYLHHPLPESEVARSGTSEKNTESSRSRQAAHADIQSLQESAEISGRVVLLSRGGCGFLEKVKWAQRRGAIALIVGDDTRGGSLVTMYARGDTSNVTIPSLFTSYTTAHLLSSLVPPQERVEQAVFDKSGASNTEVSGHGGPGKGSGTAAFAVPSPSSAQLISSDRTVRESGSGIFQTLRSLLGLGSNDGGTRHLSGDSRRPPSSGNINWIPMGHWDDQERSRNKAGHEQRQVAAENRSKDRESPSYDADSVDGDGFVIGVQDWRDPDLIAPKNSGAPGPTGAAGAKPQDEKGPQHTSELRGGRITPGSGEYHIMEKSGASKDSSGQKSAAHETPSEETPEAQANWFSRHFLRAKSKVPESVQTTGEKDRGVRTERTTHNASAQGKLAKSKEHEGLWVTLTPTSMSTSPFFDTLLVLVVSPLLTLSVVYVLLLLRSRIRRRRWRAPKSVVERLPVRTYHTIPTSSSSSSLRSSSPGPVTQTSPLLGSKSVRSPPRRQNTSGNTERKPMESSRREKSGTSTWRRKYTGRQVECVVCLEEYIDGQSRVMSLPCGHEFHAECITPWLTTRRRTCPICKGDVVRSMTQNRAETLEAAAEDRTLNPQSHHGAPSAPVAITGVGDDDLSDLEGHLSSDARSVERHPTPPSWRNFAALSFSALSGDTIWHQGRADSDR